MIANPIQTAEVIGHAIAHPVQTAQAAGHAIKETAKGIAAGMPAPADLRSAQSVWPSFPARKRPKARRHWHDYLHSLERALIRDKQIPTYDEATRHHYA